MEEEIINFDLLKQILGDEKEVFSSFCDLFKSQTKIDNTDLEKFIKENNWEVVSKISHKIKSSYGNIGSTSAYNKLAEMEKASKEEPDYSRIHEKFEQFLMIHNRILEEIDKYLSV